VQTGSLLLDAVSPSQVNIQVPPALTGKTYLVPQSYANAAQERYLYLAEQHDHASGELLVSGTISMACNICSWHIQDGSSIGGAMSA
jgi:hypothetical protein